VTARTEMSTGILVQAQIELSTMLDDRGIERREQHVVLVVQLGHGHHQQAMILAGVAIHEGRARVGSRTVRAEHFLGQHFLEIGHLCLVET